jgi:hypothetical protein
MITIPVLHVGRRSCILAQYIYVSIVLYIHTVTPFVRLVHNNILINSKIHPQMWRADSDLLKWDLRNELYSTSITLDCNFRKNPLIKVSLNSYALANSIGNICMNLGHSDWNHAATMQLYATFSECFERVLTMSNNKTSLKGLLKV